MVRHRIMVGLRGRVAVSAACDFVRGRGRPPGRTAQLWAAKRFTASSDTASAVSPSIEMLLLSYSTVSFDRPR